MAQIWRCCGCGVGRQQQLWLDPKPVYLHMPRVLPSKDQHRFDLWPGNFHMLQVWTEKKEKKKCEVRPCFWNSRTVFPIPGKGCHPPRYQTILTSYGSCLIQRYGSGPSFLSFISQAKVKEPIPGLVPEELCHKEYFWLCTLRADLSLLYFVGNIISRYW